MEPKIYLSVVIRVRNGARTLRQLFGALIAQQCSFKWEIVVVDNESEDETLEICKQYNARVVKIRCEEWTSPGSKNLGISAARGELILICSQHSIPVGSHFFEDAVAPFADPKMAAVRCLVGSNMNQTAEWYMPRDIQYKTLKEQETAESGLNWISQYPTCCCCVIRKSVWEQIPYNKSYEFGADKFWAREVLRKGYKIRCCAEAVYIYNRKIGTRDSWRRKNRELRVLHRATGYVPLSWPQFFIRVVKAAFFAPLAGIRYFVRTVMLNVNLVSIPWRAKYPPMVGSHPEYDKSIINAKWNKLIDRFLG